MTLLSFEKPKKLRSTEDHNEMFQSDCGVAGTYVSNMSELDRQKWKAKHINKGKENERIEIRKCSNINGTNILIVVGKHETKISMNGPYMFSTSDTELFEVIEEAKKLIRV